MKMLIGCESSGIVRDAFIARGHNAVSCDLLECERPGLHIRGDVLDHIRDGWDCGIFFPPCTHLAVSGALYFARKREAQQAAIDFVLALANAPIDKIAIENPIGVLSTRWRKPDQIIQPYNFGEDASKRTCLWLKNLLPLVRTKYIAPRLVNGKPRWANQTDGGQNRLGPSPTRAADRARTYNGIAQAMAQQWSSR